MQHINQVNLIIELQSEIPVLFLVCHLAYVDHIKLIDE